MSRSEHVFSGSSLASGYSPDVAKIPQERHHSGGWRECQATDTRDVGVFGLQSIPQKFLKFVYYDILIYTCFIVCKL